MKQYDVDPQKLAQVFDNTTASYKFYWFVAILDVIKHSGGQEPITFLELVARMMGKAWYPLTSGLYSFGKCDALLRRTHELIFGTELNIRDMEERVVSFIMSNAEESIIKELVKKMTVYVPYKFLSPWIGSNLTNKEVAEASQNFTTNRCPYAIIRKTIIINPAWREYLVDHRTMFYNATLFDLMRFLERYNANILVPDKASVQTTADGCNMADTQLGVSLMVESSSLEYELKSMKKLLNDKDEEINFYRRMLMSGAAGRTINIIGEMVSGGDSIKNVEHFHTNKKY